MLKLTLLVQFQVQTVATRRVAMPVSKPPYGRIDIYIPILMHLHQQQNKWHPLPKWCLHSIFAVANLLAHNNLAMVMFLWVNKFGRAKIECSFEMGGTNKWYPPNGGTIYFAVDGMQKRNRINRFVSNIFLNMLRT